MRYINTITITITMVRSGEEVFCGCGGFRFSIRVIYGAAVFMWVGISRVRRKFSRNIVI